MKLKKDSASFAFLAISYNPIKKFGNFSIYMCVCVCMKFEE